MTLHDLPRPSTTLQGIGLLERLVAAFKAFAPDASRAAAANATGAWQVQVQALLCVRVLTVITENGGAYDHTHKRTHAHPVCTR